MSSLLITNARLVDAFSDARGSVSIADGRIAQVGGDIRADGFDSVIDARGMVVMPALCDLHCHLRDPGFPAKETMETGMRAALAGGYATLTAMANTAPVITSPAQVLKNIEKASELRLCRLFQAAAAGHGLSDVQPTDRAALSEVTPVLSNDGNTIFDDAFMERLLMDSAEYGFFISTHCQPERRTVERDLRLLERVGGDLHVGHISRAETVDMIRAAKRSGLKLTCEVTPHHLFGCDSPYRVNPPLRTKADTEALLAGIADGTVDCLATDHAPHTPQDKLDGLAGISNIEYALSMYWTKFAEAGLSLSLLSRLGAYNPSLRLNVNGGRLAAGCNADVVVFDPDAQWELEPEHMLSRSRNTPFGGAQLRGKALMTIVEGEIRYDYGQTV
ncbi:MAG: dihydroorotase [Clostridia bacterium]|nr:dihydroorotase [Clostridia bacterium]